ncbi:MAG: alpha/beta fold hydrolase [Acidimicrobiales bacterium]|nr:alpha/beta fold hydrolase [Acidimicrobiales bacterium]
MTEQTDAIRRRLAAAPPLRLLALEQRVVYELGAFVAASPVLRLVGRGDRHPVLILPGFTAGDGSTLPLRWFLRGQGYWTHGWGLGRNIGPTRWVLAGIRARLEELHERHGRPISLIGWSLGGIYARELAREYPDAVRQVITLGSPFRVQDGDRTNASALFERNADRYPPEVLDGLIVPEHEKVPLTVPATAIYTRTDGIVKWWLCLESEGPLRESIEVRGSHTGLGFNPAVLGAIADRLAQPEGHWKPFRPAPGARYWYPRPVAFRAA